MEIINFAGAQARLKVTDQVQTKLNSTQLLSSKQSVRGRNQIFSTLPVFCATATLDHFGLFLIYQGNYLINKNDKL